MWFWWWSHHCHHTLYDFDNKILTLSSYLIWLWWWIHSHWIWCWFFYLFIILIWLWRWWWWWSHYCYHAWYDFDDLLTVNKFDMTMMMIPSMSSYSIWLWSWWWSHRCQHTSCDSDDYPINIIVLDMTRWDFKDDITFTILYVTLITSL